MKSFFKFLLVAALVMGLMTVSLGVLIASHLLTQPDISISINGAALPIHELNPAQLVLGASALVIAFAVVVVVVPLSLLLGLALPLLMLALALGLGLLALLGVGTLAMSPLLLIVLPLLWLLRRKPKAAA